MGTPPPGTTSSATRNNIVDVIVKQEKDDIEDELAIELDGVPTTQSLPEDEIVKVKQEPGAAVDLDTSNNVTVTVKEEHVDIDELLKDCDDDIEDIDTPPAPVDNDDKKPKVVKSNSMSMIQMQCPTCKEDFMGTNRLKLHIDSAHDLRCHNIICPICKWRMKGLSYEHHVYTIKSHHMLLDHEQYLLTPEVMRTVKMEKPRMDHLRTKFEAKPDTFSEVFKFDTANPFDQFLTQAARQKRQLDCEAVKRILRENVQAAEGSKPLKANLTSNEQPIMTNRPDKVDSNHSKYGQFYLNNKVEFICGLHLNSYYKQYLLNLKKLKVRKRILEKFRNKMTTEQTKELETKIAIEETTLYTPPQRKYGNQYIQHSQHDTVKNVKMITNNLIKKGVLETQGKTLVVKAPNPKPSFTPAKDADPPYLTKAMQPAIPLHVKTRMGKPSVIEQPSVIGVKATDGQSTVKLKIPETVTKLNVESEARSRMIMRQMHSSGLSGSSKSSEGPSRVRLKIREDIKKLAAEGEAMNPLFYEGMNPHQPPKRTVIAHEGYKKIVPLTAKQMAHLKQVAMIPENSNISKVRKQEEEELSDCSARKSVRKIDKHLEKLKSLPSSNSNLDLDQEKEKRIFPRAKPRSLVALKPKFPGALAKITSNIEDLMNSEKEDDTCDEASKSLIVRPSTSGGGSTVIRKVANKVNEEREAVAGSKEDGKKAESFEELLKIRQSDLDWLASVSPYSKFKKIARTTAQNLINVIGNYHLLRDGGGMSNQRKFQQTVFPHYHRLKDEGFPVDEINQLVTAAVKNVMDPLATETEVGREKSTELLAAPIPLYIPSLDITVSVRSYVELFKARDAELDMLASSSEYSKFKKAERTPIQNLINVIGNYHELRDKGWLDNQQQYQGTVWPHYNRLKKEGFPVEEINELLTKAVENAQKYLEKLQERQAQLRSLVYGRGKKVQPNLRGLVQHNPEEDPLSDPLEPGDELDQAADPLEMEDEEVETVGSQYDKEDENEKETEGSEKHEVAEPASSSKAEDSNVEVPEPSEESSSTSANPITLNIAIDDILC